MLRGSCRPWLPTAVQVFQSSAHMVDSYFWFCYLQRPTNEQVGFRLSASHAGPRPTRAQHSGQELHAWSHALLLPASVPRVGTSPISYV